MAAHAHETPLARTRRARRVNRTLAERYPDAHCELDHTGPFELLVATVLSAQTTDVRVNQTTPELFARYPGPAQMAGADPADLEQLLYSLGFFRAKTRHVQRLSADLLARFGGEVPGRMVDLVTLPGVGRKTANVVLGNAFGVPGITVDTHVERLSHRLGFTTCQTPDDIEADLNALVERREWTMFSHRMVFHGRRTCFASNPACGACPVAAWCPSVGTGEMDTTRAAAMLKG
ncbi:MAG: endonuclease III [Micrococcales bacterium]|nr:endonuclease III [Micrococcales bacterium]